jgi:hypothetical protein
LNQDEWLNELLKEAKTIIEDEILGEKLHEKIYIVNTRRGARKYYELTKNVPEINATFWDEEYGNLETHKGVHFIFLNDMIVSNWIYGDTIATIIHEILHAIFPTASEKEIKEMEDHCCRVKNIKREWILRVF